MSEQEAFTGTGPLELANIYEVAPGKVWSLLRRELRSLSIRQPSDPDLGTDLLAVVAHLRQANLIYARNDPKGWRRELPGSARNWLVRLLLDVRRWDLNEERVRMGLDRAADDLAMDREEVAALIKNLYWSGASGLSEYEELRHLLTKRGVAQADALGVPHHTELFPSDG